MFGRVTAILTEHRHLGETMQGLEEMCRALEGHERAGPLAAAPVSLLGEFLGELAEHFALEEADDYFGTMAREQPSLAHAITELEAEHAEMLGTLRELLAAVDDERKSRAVARGVRRIVERLRAHEHRETQVMQRFILREEGTGAD